LSLLLLLQADLPELVAHRSGHRVLLQVLHPDCPRYLAPDLLALVRPAAKIYEPPPAPAGAGAAREGEPGGAAAEAEPLAAAEEEGEGEEEEGEEEEDDEGSLPRLAAGPLGASKKAPDVRRRELLGGGLGAKLVALCAESAPAWIATQHAADVVLEVCRGGEGGVLEAAVGAAAVDAVHAALVAAAAQPRGEAAEQGEGRAGGGAHVLESYWGSRALRRLVLASADGGPAGEAAARFVAALWSGALKGRCAEFVGTHAAKVLAAVVLGGSAAAKKGAAAELKKCLPKGQTLDGWAQGLLQAKAPTK
jgi:pumilio family protein 6